MSEHHRTTSWKLILRTTKPRVAAALPAPCVNGCGRLVEHGSTFDLGHIVDVAAARRLGWTEQQINDASNLGPAHPKCNRSAGGKAGRAIQVAASKQKRRLPSW
ncbi:hypothetical protein I8920_09460 [Curtobacterium sp. YC1]|uniref:hypothetical protein n=1 Tax=Curtobacterium sp. YC1 TaxID=2795488 RepID=UPI0018E55806|nr:hypothetical protein [Curtobacterium sp. YC1]QQD75095.1 hypothetical protein I8920_09460 [Curtobacterium sp. YC1]